MSNDSDQRDSPVPSGPSTSLKPETVAIHSGFRRAVPTGDVMAPIHLSTTFERAADGSYPGGFDYSRSGNPNREELELCLAALEGGAEAIATPSGMSATHAVFSALSPGDRVVIPTDTYFGTSNLLKSHFERWGLEVVTVDLTQPEEAAAGITAGTRLVWIETPSNPQIAITNLSETVRLARSAGALTACDNTWATPVLQRPFEFGVDIVVHSTTKYLAGHSDTMGGVVIFRDATELTERVRGLQTVAGIVPSALDCWLVRRGLYTLSCRMRTHCENAQALAEHLSERPEVERVHYPGLTSDPGHEIAASQMTGFGGMLSAILAGGRDRAFEVASRLELTRRATSLGGPESLVEHRASIEGPETRAPEGLLRVSVGLEHIDDLCRDWDQALST